MMQQGNVSGKIHGHRQNNCSDSFGQTLDSMQAAANSAIRGVSLENLGACTLHQVPLDGVHAPPSSAPVAELSNQLTLYCPDQLSPVLAAR